MFVYKYNDFTKQYYHYDMDFYDFMSPMFDETLHQKVPTTDEKKEKESHESHE